MLEIRAFISKESMESIGSSCQQKAYTSVATNKVLLDMFEKAYAMSEADKDHAVMKQVHRHLLDYAVHARSEVKWRKYREAHRTKIWA